MISTAMLIRAVIRVIVDSSLNIPSTLHTSHPSFYPFWIRLRLGHCKLAMVDTCVLGFFDALSGLFVSRGPPRTTHNRKSQNSSRQMGRSYKAASKMVAIGAGHLGRLPMSRWTALPTAIPAPCPVSRKPNNLQNIFSG